MSPSPRWRPSRSVPRLTSCFQGLAAGLLEAAVEEFSREAARRRVELILRRTLELLSTNFENESEGNFEKWTPLGGRGLRS